MLDARIVIDTDRAFKDHLKAIARRFSSDGTVRAYVLETLQRRMEQDGKILDRWEKRERDLEREQAYIADPAGYMARQEAEEAAEADQADQAEAERKQQANLNALADGRMPPYPDEY